MNSEIKVEQFWVYQLRDGTYFRLPWHGLWTASDKTDFTTDNPMEAKRYPEIISDKEPPYLHQALSEGKWVKMKLTSTIKMV